MTERVLSIHLAPAHHDEMVAVDRVEAQAGAGLVGDRYHGTHHRHVSVQAADALHVAGVRLRSPVDAERTRRNITISGSSVPSTPGSRITLGLVELEVVRIAAPCRIMEASIGPGARSALHGLGGSICRILVGGEIRVGDPVQLQQG